MAKSVTTRLLRGSAISWVGIGVTMGSQILVTPIFLSYWQPALYGQWLTILAAVGMLGILESSYQCYVGFEMMRIGKHRHRSYSKMIQSGLRGAWLVAGVQLAIVIGVLLFHPWSLETHTPQQFLGVDEMSWCFAIMVLGQIPLANITNIWGRVVICEGGYERCAWWAIFVAVVTNVIPVLAVPMGAGIYTVSCMAAGSSFLLTVARLVDYSRIGREHIRRQVRPQWTIVWSTLWRSQVLTAKTLFESLRQQGVRIILASLSGSVALATFSTIRTGSNIALQGLGTITGPLMPELMKMLGQRDQARTEAAFASIWLVVVSAMAPVVIVVQLFAPAVFEVWTRGKIPFDPLLFALLSAGVLVYACVQPAIAIVQGNNLLRPQILLSAFGAVIAVGGMFGLVPRIGILGAAVALLAAEIGAGAGYVLVARSWMGKNRLRWPEGAFMMVCSSVLVSTVGMLGISLFPNRWMEILAVIFLLLIGAARLYWHFLPEIAQEKINGLIKTICTRLLRVAGIRALV